MAPGHRSARLLSRGDERFRALFEHAPMGVALCDLDGRFCDVNPALRDLLAGTEVDTDRGDLADLLCHTPAESEEAGQWQQGLDAVREGRRPVARVLLSLAPADAAPRLVQATAARVVLGERAYLLAHIEDATGRRLDQQRLVYLATHDALTGLHRRRAARDQAQDRGDDLLLEIVGKDRADGLGTRGPLDGPQEERRVRAHRGNQASLLDKLGPDFKRRLAFLDGDHGFEAVCEDIRNIDKHLLPGGWICFDDAFTCYEGVSRAISELIIANPHYELCQQMTRKLFVARKLHDLDRDHAGVFGGGDAAGEGQANSELGAGRRPGGRTDGVPTSA